jgi:hypothetical protein
LGKYGWGFPRRFLTPTNPLIQSVVSHLTQGGDEALIEALVGQGLLLARQYLSQIGRFVFVKTNPRW